VNGYKATAHGFTEEEVTRGKSYPADEVQKFLSEPETPDEEFVSRALSRGQGRGLSAEERRIVEQHAMERAREYLKEHGQKVTDRSANHPYDFEARKGSSKMFIEVKGTTGGGESVLVTAGEVRAQRQAHPNNGLIVVHSIKLTKSEHGPAAKGGVLIALMPWNISDAALDPVAYSYQINTNGEANVLRHDYR